MLHKISCFFRLCCGTLFIDWFGGNPTLEGKTKTNQPWLSETQASTCTNESVTLSRTLTTGLAGFKGSKKGHDGPLAESAVLLKKQAPSDNTDYAHKYQPPK